MRILLSAFACEPNLGSEEGVGWGAAWSLSAAHEVHVLTHPRHREKIEHFMGAHPPRTLTFSYYDVAPFLRRLVVTSSLWQLYYYYWQRRIARWSRAAVETFNPEVVHHVTYGRYWTPTSLWQLGRPLVWGPLGGADNCPQGFAGELPARERWAERLRPIVQGLAHFDPALRATARRATIALASTPATAAALRAIGCNHVLPLLQMGLDRTEVEEGGGIRPIDGPPIFCCIGKLCGWKGQFLALRAFARAKIPDARLVILGAGSAQAKLVQWSEQLGIAAAVDFRGKVPREETRRQLRTATALVHPSLHDQAPTVVFEAMALGIPVVALNLAGPSIQVDATCGILIDAMDPEQVVEDLAAAMRRLALRRADGVEMGRGGRRRVLDFFTWDKKADQFVELYREAIALHHRSRSRAGSAALTRSRAAGAPSR